MTLSTTLSAALSGLTAASRASEIAASNIANAMTESYGRRELQLASRQVGGTSQGVEIQGVTRRVNLTLMNDRRIAEAGAAGLTAQQKFLAGLETALGNSDSAASLVSRISSFDAALVTAAGRPDSLANLNQLANAARSLAGTIGTVADDVQTARMRADAEIGRKVDTLNTGLQQVHEMNLQILSLQGTGQDPSALFDQRQKLVDELSQIMPLREYRRENGQIALFGANGAMLVDSSVAVIGFSPTGVITPDMTLGGGALSGLTLNGIDIPANGSGALMSGGSLSAQFAIRDELAPAAQSQLDAIARDLVERFQDPALDPTLLPGDAGLFTDLGTAFDPLNENGLAQRLRLNAAVDPDQGGALWRLRDGIGAATPGNAGNTTLLVALQQRLGELRPPASGQFLPGLRNFASLATELTSDTASARLSLETEASFATAKAETLQQAAHADGVDTDQELQAMMQIERLYAANAKVIQAVDSMLDELMRIG